jgi:microsomal epoxide hydrolase
MAFAQKTIPVRPFTISHSEQEVADLKTLIRLSPLSDETYENNAMHEHKFGPSRAWMQETKSAWQDFDWFSAQADLNRFPHFIAEVPDVDPKTGTTGVLQVHFIGIESPHPDAVPVMILHGWPGNFFELLPLVSHLLGSPSNPPMHLIIPRSVRPLSRRVAKRSVYMVYG